ncbi:unnamed protein product [Haemonchus placei]|uniref:RUN domain-containing protein n=1 Tax=Haemonchus placei TaxID=6290 RepID=A0A0N4VU43_HAEPC|nr:unnamed protein product [Haemonchus placei]
MYQMVSARWAMSRLTGIVRRLNQLDELPSSQTESNGRRQGSNYEKWWSNILVTKNIFLSHSMKYSTLSTIIWSMLRAKRQRLKHGFIAHVYDVSEAVSPAITLGFLGTDSRIGELLYCVTYFKIIITQFVADIFNSKRVRYTTLDELAEDVWIILENRTEAIRTRLATELIPV